MPKTLKIAEDVVPINEFKTNASKLINRMKQTQRPVVITQNGRPCAVMLTPEEFDALTYRHKLIASVQEGLEDTEAGRTYTTAQVQDHIRSKLER